MFAYLKNLFRQPSAAELAYRELAEATMAKLEATMAKLEAETAVDYATAIVAYNDARIKRLEAHLTQHSKEQAK